MKRVLRKTLTLLCAAVLMLSSVPVYAAGTEELARWTFEDGEERSHWYYGDGWDWDYHGSKPGSISWEKGRMRMSLDFSRDGERTTAQVAAGFWHEGFSLPGASRLTMDLFFQKEKLDNSFTVRVTSDSGIEGSAIVSAKDCGEPDAQGFSRAKVTIDFPALSSLAKVKDLTLVFTGNRTTYFGAMYIDNISIWKTDGLNGQSASGPEVYGNASVVPVDYKPRKLSSDLKTFSIDGSVETTPLPKVIKLVDPQAEPCVQDAYLYLSAMGASGSVVFGQQANTWQKAGSPLLSWSDTMDLTGSYTGIVGMDTTDLAGDYSVAAHNNRFRTNYADKPAQRVEACAEMANWTIQQGALLALTARMPNFTKVEGAEKGHSDSSSYGKYNFSEDNSYNMEGDPAHAVLSGGEAQKAFNAYLDMIAGFAKRVDGAILFTPFPEKSGEWIWWGTAGCDAEAYQKMYRYTVEYLRDTCGVHNLLYVYSPAGDTDAGAYKARYPGDTYVDLVGFGMYHTNGRNGDGWMDRLRNTAVMVDSFASEHGKLMAVTDAGPARSEAFAGSTAAALDLTGNAYTGWYQDVLNAVADTSASYWMTGQNSFREGFCVPYAVSRNADNTLRGHELMDDFIRFFNDPRSVFACHQKDLLASAFPKAQVLPAEEMGGIVSTTADAALVTRLTASAGKGKTILLQPAKGAGTNPTGSRLVLCAEALPILTASGAGVKADGPFAAITVSSEEIQALAEREQDITFLVEKSKDTAEVSVWVGDSRLGYVPGGIQADIYTEASSAKLVTNKIDFPYGNPLEILLGAASPALSGSGRYTASMEVKDGRIAAWSLTDHAGKVLFSGTGLEKGSLTLDGGKSLTWTLGAGNVLTWEIAENGKTILTGSAQMGIAGKTQALFDDEPENVKDGTYTVVMELKNGNVVKWSYLEPGSKTAQSGGGIQAAAQIDPKEIDCQTVSTEHGTALRVSLPGSAKLKLTAGSEPLSSGNGG